MHPQSLSWVELKEYMERKREPLVLPIGSVEGHGLHLPINTDTLIAEFIADKLAERNNWISLPPITYTIAVPVRPGNVHIPVKVFREYLKSILEHFISFSQKKFIIVMGHGGPEMKNSIIEACDYLCKKYDTLIAIFHASQILRKLGLINTSIDKHAGMWETSIIMAIDDNLVKNLDFYKKHNNFYKYGVIGDPLKASPNKGLKFAEAIINYIESIFRRLMYHNICYYEK